MQQSGRDGLQWAVNPVGHKAEEGPYARDILQAVNLLVLWQQLQVVFIDLFQARSTYASRSCIQ